MNGCTYPIVNPFASAAPPKPCGSTNGAIAVSVPYYDRKGNTQLQLQMLCNQHTAEVACWKFIRNLPRQPLFSDEIDFLLQNGFTANEVQAEGLMLPPETPDELGES